MSSNSFYWVRFRISWLFLLLFLQLTSLQAGPFITGLSSCSKLEIISRSVAQGKGPGMQVQVPDVGFVRLLGSQDTNKDVDTTIFLNEIPCFMTSHRRNGEYLCKCRGMSLHFVSCSYMWSFNCGCFIFDTSASIVHCVLLGCYTLSNF